MRPLPSGDIDSVNMTINGQAVVFPAGSVPPKQFAWPSTTQNVLLSVKFKSGQTYPYPGYDDGLWSVFEFVEEADAQTPGTPTTIRRDLGSGNPKRVTKDAATGHDVTVSFEIVANPPVFDKGYFSGLGCVANVAR